MNRRSFLSNAGAAAAGTVAAGLVGCQRERSERGGPGESARRARGGRRDAGGRGNDAAPGTETWEGVRAHFALDPELVHMAGLLLASHPAPVRDAIDGHRRALDGDPAGYVQSTSRFQARVRSAAARYMGVRPDELALTDSTSMGTALAITGLRIRPDQEMLTARFDYYVTREAIAYQAARSGASHREVPLYRNIQRVTEDEIVESLTGAIRDRTRLVTATWVHSATGLKMPIRRISDRIADINAGRADDDRIVLFVDGVHGFGVEDVDIPDLGCDLFSAGTHKWMHGPRGTGVLWGHPRVHGAVRPTIPTFTREAGWGGLMSPGGFKPFEHQWAMAEAFGFHLAIGRRRIRDRIYGLAGQLKRGLAEMRHVTLRSPLDDALTAGIICFDVDGFSAGGAARALRGHGVVASRTPYSPSHARLAPGIYNTEDDVDAALRAVRALR